MPRTPDRKLAQIARKQAGAFNRTQATSAGMSARMLQTRERRGEIERRHGDVWVFRAAPPTWLRDCWAATLVHPVAALSHATAGAFLDLDVDRRNPVEVTVPPGATHEARGIIVHRSRHHRYASHSGLRVTRFEQVLVQLAATDPDLVEGVLHTGVDREPMRLERLLRHLDRLAGSRLPGLRSLTELAVDLEGDPPTQSELERRLLRLTDDVLTMPAVRRQATAPWAPDSTSVVDAVVPDWRLILEADGRAFHQRRADFERDRWRDAEAAIAGFHVMRFTYRRLEHDRAGVIDQLERYGAARGHRAA